jgi:hypothetical protein
MGVNLWGAAFFGKSVPCTKTELETKDSIPNVIFQDEVLGEGNCGEATNRGEEAGAKAAR